MTRLAICAAGELFGGVERQILDLCRYRSRSGSGDPLVILFHDHELGTRLRAGGVTPIIINGACRYDIRLAGRIGRILRDEQIDVVHVHGYRAMVTCGMARISSRVRLVKTEHGLHELGGGSLLGKTKARANAFLDNFFTRRRCAAVCYVTRDIAARYERAHDGLERFHVPNGIDPLERERFARPPEFAPAGIHVGLVGRISAVKAIDVAVRAFADFGDYPEARLWIIGTGPLEQELRKLVRSLGAASRITFLGFQEEIYAYLAHLDILLMPSWHEGLPYSLLEGMSLGRAIVVSRVGGLQEVIRDGVTGLMVPPGDIASLGKAVAALVADAPLRHQLGRAAQGDQMTAYTLTAMGVAYDEIYDGRDGETCRAARLANTSRMRAPSTSQL